MRTPEITLCMSGLHFPVHSNENEAGLRRVQSTLIDARCPTCRVIDLFSLPRNESVIMVAILCNKVTVAAFYFCLNCRLGQVDAAWFI